MQKRSTAIIVSIIFSIIAAGLAVVSVKLSLLFILGIAVTVIVFLKPFHGLILYILLLYIRPQDFIPGLGRFRIMLVMAVILILVFLTQKIARNEKIPIFVTQQHLLIFVLLLIVPISDITNGRISEAWESINEFLTVFLLFYIIVYLTDTFEKFRKVCWIMVFCTTLLAINGIIMHFRGYDLLGTTPVEITRIRYIGIFGDPNDFALAINSIFPFVLVTMLKREIRGIKKLFLLCICIVYMMALYYTNSRGGYIAFIVMLAFFSIRRWGILKGAAVGVLLLFLAIVLAPDRMGDLSPYGRSASGRVNAWIYGLVFLKSRPLLGIGFENFAEYNYGVAAHSAFIKCMAELGLVGYFTWLALLYTSFRDIRIMESRDDSPYSDYAFMLQLALVGFLGSSFFLSQTYMPILYILIALIAISVRNSRVLENRPKLMHPVEVLKVTALMGLSIIAYKVLAMIYI